MLERREGGCHCGRVRFQAQVDLDLLSQCNCSICTKKGILHLPVAVEDFEFGAAGAHRARSVDSMRGFGKISTAVHTFLRISTRSAGAGSVRRVPVGRGL